MANNALLTGALNALFRSTALRSTWRLVAATTFWAWCARTACPAGPGGLMPGRWVDRSTNTARRGISRPFRAKGDPFPASESALNLRG